jgi:hypothetical protein
MPSSPAESPTRTALKSGGAAVLICSSAIFLAGRPFFDLYELLDGQPLERPGSFAVGMVVVGLVLPVLALGAVVFTFYVCLSRCRLVLFGSLTKSGTVPLECWACALAASGMAR